VASSDGVRAIGTYVPAINPDGTPDPVIAALIKGEAYRGLAYVVNTWYVTAYEPIFDKSGRVIGALYVGVKQDHIESLRQAILKTRVGKTGHVYVLGGTGEDRGHYIISRNSEHDGEDVWESTDATGRLFIQSIIEKAVSLEPGGSATEYYYWQDPGEPAPRLKVARIIYYEPWDWVIGVSTYVDDFQDFQLRLQEGRASMMLVFIAAGIGIALLTGGVIWLSVVKITQPIQELTRTATIIAEGDLSKQVQVSSRDELGTLAKTFNQMTANLRRMIEAEQHTVVEYVAFADRVRAGDLTGQLQLNGNADDPLTRLGQNINRLVADLRQRVSTEQEARAHLEQTVDHYLGFVERVADGDLTARLSLNGRQDALTILGQNLNSMVERLSEMTSQIREATANIAAAAAEILTATTQQASGASEQSAAIAQTSTTIDEVKLIVEQAFAKAQSVAEQAQRTQAVSQAGQHAVKETVGSMRQIKDKVEGIAENILSLSEQTQQIGNIITTVNDIAAQSNLLALNASVEAARAGEHGRGFAVVAVEVRNLAEQSRQATAQVKALLNEIQRATNAAVMATEEGVKGVDSGVVQTGQAGETIEQLAAGIAANASAAQQIVASAQQQTTGIEQLALAMQSINQATVQSLASTRQAEKAARDLSALAEQMESLVGRYRLVI
jgi:methyl-accepting chemotaxis protein